MTTILRKDTLQNFRDRIGTVGISVLALSAFIILSGCTDMYDQPKYKPLRESKFYKDGASSRSPIEGTVAKGTLKTDELLHTGKLQGQFADVFPFPVTEAILRNGEKQFNTFCTPCHGALGDGTGMIVRRGFPKPNSFHSDSVRARPVGYYVDVMTNGFGRMYSYAPSVTVNERWAIAAYIRALQLSQNIRVSDLSDDERSRIMKMKK